MNVTLNFNQKVTTGVYRAVLDHKNTLTLIRAGEPTGVL